MQNLKNGLIKLAKGAPMELGKVVDNFGAAASLFVLHGWLPASSGSYDTCCV